MTLPLAKPKWFLVHCKPWEDSRALKHLLEQGYECYGPTLKVERRRQGRKVIVQEPLFPQYVFIRLDEITDHWHPIRSTRGVSSIVCRAGRPVPVRDDVIDGVRARLTTDIEPIPYLKEGERVEIIEGSFANFEAIFLAKDGKERVVLLLSIMQTDQRVSFPIQYVRKLA